MTKIPSVRHNRAIALNPSAGQPHIEMAPLKLQPSMHLELTTQLFSPITKTADLTMCLFLKGCLPLPCDERSFPGRLDHEE